MTAIDLSSTTGIKAAKGFDVSGVMVVPETSTWAMMLTGLLGLGFAGYRRSRGPRLVPLTQSTQGRAIVMRIPEASTWAKMGLGFAGLGFAALPQGPEERCGDRLTVRNRKPALQSKSCRADFSFKKLMTKRSLAVLSIVLVIGNVSPGAAGTKVISGAFAIPASPALADDLDGLDAGSTSNGAAALPANTEPADAGTDALEPARIADPPYSGLQGMLNTILQLAPAASH